MLRVVISTSVAVAGPSADSGAQTLLPPSTVRWARTEYSRTASPRSRRRSSSPSCRTSSAMCPGDRNAGCGASSIDARPYLVRNERDERAVIDDELYLPEPDRTVGDVLAGAGVIFPAVPRAHDVDLGLRVASAYHFPLRGEQFLPPAEKPPPAHGAALVHAAVLIGHVPAFDVEHANLDVAYLGDDTLPLGEIIDITDAVLHRHHSLFVGSSSLWALGSPGRSRTPGVRCRRGSSACLLRRGTADRRCGWAGRSPSAGSRRRKGSGWRRRASRRSSQGAPSAPGIPSAESRSTCPAYIRTASASGAALRTAAS